jgi:hypothetical protein
MTPTRRQRIVCLVAAMFVFLVSSHVPAQEGNKAEARKVFFEAGEALNDGDYLGAVDLYRHANELYPAPTSAIGLARALAQMGRLVEASEVYSGLGEIQLSEDAPAPFRKAVEDGASEGAALDKRVPRVNVALEGMAPSSVSLDGKPITLTGSLTVLRRDPGHVTLSATRSGYQPFEKKLSLGEATVTDVTISLVPIAVTKPKPVTASPEGLDGMQIAGIAIGAAGVLGLGAWGVTGVLYLGEEATVEKDCVDNRCRTQAGLDAADSAKTLGVVNTVSLVVGLALAGVGTTLFLLGGSDATEPSVALQLGSTVSLSGTF